MNSFWVVDLGLRLPLSESASQTLRSKPTMAISAVCSRWQRNALSMPVIWSQILLYWNRHDNWEDEDMEIFFPLFNFLSQSQQHPLTILLKLKEDPFAFEEKLHPLIVQLFGQMARWQYLSWQSPEYSRFEFLEFGGKPAAALFPALRTLCIPRCVEYLTRFMETSLNLQVLSLPDGDIRYLQGFNSLLLSHLDFDCVLDHTVNLSDRFPNLVSLGVPESSPSGYLSNYMEFSSSSKLEILTVHHGDRWYYHPCNQPDSSNSVFPLLRLPSLKMLHLKKYKSREKYKSRKTDDGTDNKPWGNLDPFIVFVQQSSFQLTMLSIQQLSISDANLVYILVHMPTLQDLTVDDSGTESPKCSPISSEFIESLHGSCTSSLRRQTALLVPRLHSLKLLNVATSVNDLSVVDMVWSRWCPTKLHAVGTSAFEADCLRVFTSTFLNRSETEAGRDVYSMLDPIEREGMMIVIQMSGVTLRD
ncbi:hypothetical protein BDP27DRAFT_1427063 [Rhodocollybia butyracea]|uniref:F-box domain-containing protein n=1 Tax=Rhodocollybia butyracea TaxID=206335 RepID=A0A9P5PCU2_9AGAR|nr:hypothetical protein BDP27DRAFT_1427063 [Rhodocollybia butyracea]